MGKLSNICYIILRYCNNLSILIFLHSALAVWSIAKEVFDVWFGDNHIPP